MRKVLFGLLFLVSSLTLKSQIGFLNQTPNTIDSTWSIYEFNTPTATYGNRTDWFHISRTTLKFRSGIIKFDSFSTSRNDGTIVGNLAWLDANGYLRTSPSPYVTPNSSALFTNKTGDISQWTNNVGYLTAITSGNVTTALTYTPINPNGTSLQYFRGDGILQTFPSIPSAQINCDWNSVTGLSQLLNKPSLSTVATTGVYSDLTGKPTIPAAQVNSDWNAVSGVSQILNKPVIPGKRVETYLGTTDGSGNYTVTYSVAFASIPDVQPQLQAGTTQQMVRITSSSTTGFTVNATNRATVTLLSIDVLLGSTTPLTSASVGVLVTQR